MPKLRLGFTLFEILVVIAIVGFIYGLVFLPLSTKFSAQNIEYTGILSITKRYIDATALLDTKDEVLVLRCNKDYENCAFYKINGEVVGKIFALNVKSPKAIYRLVSDGTLYQVWKNDDKQGLTFLCPNGMPELFIEDDKIYKIGPIHQNNFIADSKEDAINMSLKYLPTKEAVLE